MTLSALEDKYANDEEFRESFEATTFAFVVVSVRERERERERDRESCLGVLRERERESCFGVFGCVRFCALLRRLATP